MTPEPDLGFLVLRVATGAVFVAHGVRQVRGQGLETTSAWLASLGVRPRGPILALTAGFTQVVAGTLFAVGLLTPYAAGLLIALMVVAAVVAHRPNGFFIVHHGVEYNLVLGAVALAVSMTGPGRYSVDDLLSNGGLLYRPVFQTVVPLVTGLGLAGAFLTLAYRPARRS